MAFKRVKHVTPELIEQVFLRYREIRTFRGLREHFHLTGPALSLIISGDFKHPTPDLVNAHLQTFGQFLAGAGR